MRADVVFAGRATWRQRAAIDAFNPSHNATPVQTRVIVMIALPAKIAVRIVLDLRECGKQLMM